MSRTSAPGERARPCRKSEPIAPPTARIAPTSIRLQGFPPNSEPIAPGGCRRPISASQADPVLSPSMCVAGLRALLPGRAGQGRPLRRVVLHGCDVDRHLLPAELSGHHPQAGQRPLLPDRGRRAARRLPGLQALPPGRHARLSRVEPAGRRRGPRDAPHRRRRRRPRRRPRSRRAPRVQRAPPAPPARGRGGCRAHRPRAGPTGPDSPGAHRDHRPPVHAGGLRRRVRQHPAVQRHRPRGLRHHPDRIAAEGVPARSGRSPRSGRRDGHRAAPAARATAVRR